MHEEEYKIWIFRKKKKGGGVILRDGQGQEILVLMDKNCTS